LVNQQSFYRVVWSCPRTKSVVLLVLDSCHVACWTEGSACKERSTKDAI
jgi:hypothetical protein